jgi:hypothetical protein
MVRLAAVAVSAFLSLALADKSSAQTGGPIGIETIVATLPSGGTFEQFYPNVFDLQHPKRLTFQGAIINGSTFAPTTVYFWFDWRDPRLQPPNDLFTSTPLQIPLGPGQSINPGGPTGPPPFEFIIPFCPPQVSIHIENNGQAQPLIIEGTFIHECIPEPATAGLAACGLALVAGAAHRRRDRRAV